MVKMAEMEFLAKMVKKEKPVKKEIMVQLVYKG